MFKLLKLMITGVLYFGVSLVFLLGLFSFVSYGKHLLTMMLILEYIVLSIYLFLYLFLLESFSELYFSVVFLTFSVCEGALGLSLLVSLVRSHGNDYFQSFTILQC
uniref:NADH-ubiquinone oxidoreductase chain 4L n=1 Tax=Mythicomyia sp. TaxID=2885616 RepID=A0A8K1KXW6_9MUSC|nr:NADH dehydrogenase subunit 4L [Mythicomyia sp.]